MTLEAAHAELKELVTNFRPFIYGLVAEEK